MSVILSSVFGTFARRRRQRRQPRAEFVHLAFSKQSATVRHVDLGRVHMATTTTSVCKEHAGTAERERFLFLCEKNSKTIFLVFFSYFIWRWQRAFVLFAYRVCVSTENGWNLRPASFSPTIRFSAVTKEEAMRESFSEMHLDLECASFSCLIFIRFYLNLPLMHPIRHWPEYETCKRSCTLVFYYLCCKSKKSRIVLREREVGDRKSCATFSSIEIS